MVVFFFLKIVIKKDSIKNLLVCFIYLLLLYLFIKSFLSLSLFAQALRPGATESHRPAASGAPRPGLSPSAAPPRTAASLRTSKGPPPLRLPSGPAAPQRPGPTLSAAQSSPEAMNVLQPFCCF